MALSGKYFASDSVAREIPMKLAAAAEIPPMVKMNIENELYVLWKESPETEKEAILKRLMIQLRRHAERMVWIVLQQGNHQLAVEMVHDLVLDLDKFKGNSLFSSWAHARFRNGCIDELRYRRRYLGDSLSAITPEELDANEDLLVNNTEDAKVYLSEVLESMPPEDRSVIQMILKGSTLREIAKAKGDGDPTRMSRRIANIYERQGRRDRLFNRFQIVENKSLQNSNFYD